MEGAIQAGERAAAVGRPDPDERLAHEHRRPLPETPPEQYDSSGNWRRACSPEAQACSLGRGSARRRPAGVDIRGEPGLASSSAALSRELLDAVAAGAARRLDGDLLALASPSRARRRATPTTACPGRCWPRSGRRSSTCGPCRWLRSRTSAVVPNVKARRARVRLDDDGVAQALAQAQDLRLEMSLVLLGDVVLGVLLQVAERARRLDAARHLLAARRLELVEVRLQRFEALWRDRLACHPPRR